MEKEVNTIKCQSIIALEREPDIYQKLNLKCVNLKGCDMMFGAWQRGPVQNEFWNKVYMKLETLKYYNILQISNAKLKLVPLFCEYYFDNFPLKFKQSINIF